MIDVKRYSNNDNCRNDDDNNVIHVIVIIFVFCMLYIGHIVRYASVWELYLERTSFVL